MLKKLILALVIFTYCSSILIGMDGVKKRCLSKFVNTYNTLHLSFIVTGDEATQKTSVYLYDPDQNIVFKKENEEEGEFDYQPTKDGDHKLCIHPAHDKPHFISFEFYSKFEAGHILNLAKDENIHDMKKDVSEIALMFEEIEENVRFIMDRRNKHNMLTVDFIESIKHITIFKVVVIGLVSILQIWLIRRFYSSSKKVGNPFYESGL
jgi:hypothetical protein